MMWATNEVWRFAATVVVLLLAALFLRSNRREASSLVAVFLLAGVAGHFVFPLLLRRDAPNPLLQAALLLSLSVPVAFWLLARVHFDDDFHLRPVQLVASAAFLGIGYVSWLATKGQHPPISHEIRFWALLPRLLGLAIVLHALVRIYAGARGDLVLSRLKVRFIVLGVSGTYFVIELLGEVAFSGSRWEPIAERAHSLAALAVVWGVAFLSLRLAPEMLRTPRPADAPLPHPALFERLKRLIEVEEVYREEGLTIGAMAARLGDQEYKVRQLINAHLGFKNFNAFLNHYRVQAARKLLEDPANEDLGVAQIAYRLGYSSLGPFNRAFKALVGRTPTEFRKKGPDQESRAEAEIGQPRLKAR